MSEDRLDRHFIPKRDLKKFAMAETMSGAGAGAGVAVPAGAPAVPPQAQPAFPAPVASSFVTIFVQGLPSGHVPVHSSAAVRVQVSVQAHRVQEIFPRVSVAVAVIRQACPSGQFPVQVPAEQVHVDGTGVVFVTVTVTGVCSAPLQWHSP